MNIKKILEKNGFTVSKDGDCWNIQQYTPAGEDWNLCFSKLSEIKEYAENYSPEEDFDIWWCSRKSVSGVPQSPNELWKDQLWKQEKLNTILEEMEK